MDVAIANYRKLIRWGYFDEAVKYLRTPDGKPLTIDLQRTAHYRVTAYTVSNQILADTGKDARVIAVIEYYEIDAGVIHALHDVQTWWYDAKENHWFLASPLPAFGTADTAPVTGSHDHL